jgi:hypothetical protein
MGEKLEHTYTNYVSNNDATCTTDGTKTGTCVCGEKDTIADEGSATNHPNKTTTTVDATCTVAGSETVTCDDCGETLSTNVIPAKDHTDDDNNYKCDVCDAVLSTHIDSNNDHICEYCSGVASDHFDEGDHKCDICQIIVSGCADKNGDHRCDVCAKILSECGDSNRNHFCDVCESRLSKHADDNDDGECDLCFVDVENHEDEDNDGNCDICGDPWEPWTMPWWLVLVIIFGGLALFFGIGYIICMWDDYC